MMELGGNNVLICENCGQEQHSGKFCGNCGAPIVPKTEERATEQTKKSAAVQHHEQRETTEATSEEEKALANKANSTSHSAQASAETQQENASEQDEIFEEDEDSRFSETNTSEQNTTSEQSSNHLGAKQYSTKSEQPSSLQGTKQIDYQNFVKDYWRYFVKLLKNPTTALTQQATVWPFALTNVAIYALLFAIAVTTLLRKTAGVFADLPLFSIFIGDIIFVTVILATILLGIFIIEKGFLKTGNIKVTFSQFAGMITPFIAVHLLAFITALGGSIILTPLLHFISLFFVIIVLPSLYIYEKCTQDVQQQKVYVAIGTVILIVVLLYLITRIVLASLIGELRMDIEDLLYHFFW